MPPVNRDNPVRSSASESPYSLMEFMREFPDDAACLEWLWRNRYSEDGRYAVVPEVRQGTPVPQGQGKAGVGLRLLRAPPAPARRDDLPQVLDLAAPVVLCDPLDDEHSLRSVRQAA